MHWRLHEAIFKDRTEEAAGLLRGLGDGVAVVSGPQALLPAPEPLRDGAPALAMTTLQDARRLRWTAVIPGLLWDLKRYDASFWMPRLNLPSLNSGGFFIPWGMLGRIPPKVLEALAGEDGRIFVRPDSGQKIFAGQSVPAEPAAMAARLREIGEECKGVAPEALVLAAPHRRIEPVEWRFWIARRRIAAWAPYSWDGDVPWSEAPAAVMEAAEKVAAAAWHPDTAFVADIAVHGDDALLCEINAASTSGVYGAPLQPLLCALRDVVLAEACGEIVRDPD